MVPRVTLVTGLILIVSVLALAGPNVRSQQFTTSTSFVTSTNIEYSAQTESITLYSESYYTVTSVSSSTATLTDEFATTSRGGGPCYISPTGGFNSTGASIYVHYEAAQPVTLYVLDIHDMEEGLTAGYGMGCGPFSWRDRISEGASANIKLRLPKSDNPYFLAFVAPYLSSPIIYVTVGPMSTRSSATLTTSVSIAGFSTITGTLTTPTTFTFRTKLAVPFMQTYGNWLMSGVLTAVLVVVVLFLAYRTRRHGKKASM